jgi:hypothetical protein
MNNLNYLDLKNLKEEKIQELIKEIKNIDENK